MSDETEEKPWYSGGLAFECTRCGHCCTGDPGFVWVTEEELAAIAKFLGGPFEKYGTSTPGNLAAGSTLRETSQRRLRFLRPPEGLHDLPGPPAAVPHVAVLGEQRRDPRGLGADLRRLPRVGDGRGDPGRGDHAAAEGHQDVKPCRGREDVTVRGRSSRLGRTSSGTWGSIMLPLRTRLTGCLAWPWRLVFALCRPARRRSRPADSNDSGPPAGYSGSKDGRRVDRNWECRVSDR